MIDTVDEDIPIESIRKELGMSRLEFLDFLNDDSSENRLMTSMEEEFRKHLDDRGLNGKSGAKFFSTYHLSSITVEYIDWERWKSKEEENNEKNKWKKSSHIIEDGFKFMKNLYDKQSQEIIELHNEIRKKDKYIETLEQQIQSVKIYGSIKCDGCKHLNRICSMRREHKTEEEIAKFLYDNGKWCSQSQIGALLHIEENRVASDSMTQRARRLLGKA